MDAPLYGVGELYEVLINQLKTENNYVSDEGVVKKWVVAEQAQAYSSVLIELLLANEQLKKAFFVEVKGTLVFMLDKFLQFIEQKNYINDSYTRFSQKVGLQVGGKFLSHRNEVELVFPYKDCVLEGGQTKDDQKRNEIFFNEVLAQDEITQLLEPKVLSEAKRVDTHGEHLLDAFRRDEATNVERNLPKHTITDNLIIRGNNLLALHTLKNQFSSKVKLIYIDPPYYFRKTKPGDSFSYNSNFKLSSWLVFMRDRLSVANELLNDNGIILVNIKEDGIHWLKVLMEEVFGVDNFVETFIWKNTDNPDSLSKKSRSAVEYILCFEKRKDSSRAYKGKPTENGDAPLLNAGNSVHELRFPPKSIRFNIADGVYPVGKPERVELITPVTVVNSLNENDVILKGEFKWSQSMLDDELAKGTYFIVKTNRFSIRFQRIEGTTMAPEKFIDEQYLSKAIGVGSNEDATTHLKNLGINFSFSKPESLVAFFVRAVTDENDIVLDFFLGSGTTAAVCHKMNRQYIGIDQMDYIKTAAVKRLTKVIKGEQGGVSANFNWQGGGDFVYVELKRYNEQFIDSIEAATTSEQLLEIWEQMKRWAFFRFSLDMQKFEENIEQFKSLSLNEQKQALCSVLDSNQLYVNYADMNDEELRVSDEEKRVTNDFYGK